MFFNGWMSIIRTVIVGVLAYIALVFLLRISGKRTLSKMNAFDMIVTVALGSTLATILLSRDVSLAQGVIALAVLIGLQLVITWLSVRSRAVAGMIKSEPQLLVHEGRLLPDAMRRERVLDDEIQAAIRNAGMDGLDQVQSVVLETDGTLSVVRKP